MDKLLLRILFFFTALIFCCSLQLQAQQKDYSAIDRFAKKAPPGISRLYKPLTHYLTDRYSTDDEKVRAISVWIINNIRYDAKVYRTDKRKKLSPDRILNKRKAICQGYCDLFQAMCTEAGIDAKTVVGYDKGGSYEPTDIFVRADHAWSAVNVNGSWQLIDLTWCAGYVSPKRQLFRRLLNYFLNVPFTQKYTFKKDINYNYYFTNPDTFAIDHLPVHPWWQLTQEKPIVAYEKDTTQRNRSATVNYSGGSSASIPGIDQSEEPVAYLKRAEAAFKFNPENYKTLTEGKAMYAYKWFVQTEKSKELENKQKIKVYDSCKTIMDEAKAANQMYIHFTAEERQVRRLKNKEFKKESNTFNKTQKQQIASEVQRNYAGINSIEKQIGRLKIEQRTLKNELITIDELKIPDRGKSPKRIVTKTEYVGYLKASADSVTAFKNKLQTVLTTNENENFTKLKNNEGNVDSLVEVSCKLIYKKVIVRVFFNWNYKIMLDTLRYKHFDTAAYKDTTISKHNDLLQTIAMNDLQQMQTAAQIRNTYSATLKYNYTLYNTCADSVVTNLNLKDTCEALKASWRAYDRNRITQDDEEIQRLKSKRRAINSLTHDLRMEKRYNDAEIYFEGKRYRYYNGYYFKFYRREKRKAIAYGKNLNDFKKVVQTTDTKTKEKVRDEERKEKQENVQPGKTK